MHAHHAKQPKIQFAVTGVIAGLFGGMLIGFIVEIGAGGSALAMTLGAISGALLGSGFESVRFFWKKWHSAEPPEKPRKRAQR